MANRSKRNFVDVDTAPTEQISRMIKAPLERYADIEHIILSIEDLKILKAELQRIEKLIDNLTSMLKRLDETGIEIRDKHIAATAICMRNDLDENLKSLIKIEKKYRNKIALYDSYRNIRSINRSIILSLQSAIKSHKKIDAALNEMIFHLSKMFGGYNAVYRLFRRFSEIAPAALTKSYNPDSLRKRIERYEKALK